MPKVRPVRTNEEILRGVRYFEEWEHRRRREYFAVDRPLTLSLNHSLPIPQVQLEQIQDCCNKSTAIYYMTSGQLFSVMHPIYEQWFRGHNININFGKFVAKLIRLEIPSDEQKVTGEDVIGLHKAWCEHVENSLPLCSPENGQTGTELEIFTYRHHHHGTLGINQEQYMHYKLQSTFRALIMVIDSHASEKSTETVVHLIRTNMTSELSAPITLEDVRPQFEQDLFFGHENKNVVSTTLSAAIDFVMALESREHAAFPEKCWDSSMVDTSLGSSESPMWRAREEGYTGPEIREPTTSWVKLAEGEDVKLPMTPLAIARKARLLKSCANPSLKLGPKRID